MFNIDEDKIKDWSIDRIVTVLGGGVLSDNSECSKEFRSYLKTRSIETLERHIQEFFLKNLYSWNIWNAISFCFFIHFRKCCTIR